MPAPQESMKVKYRKDYRPSSFLINEVVLHIDIRDEAAWVHSELHIHRNPAVTENEPLVLDGQELELEYLELDGKALSDSEYCLDNQSLCIPQVPSKPFVLKSRVRIEPQKNTKLEGLYASGGKYCTQCEAEGFRRITFFLDRPDVLARYTTTIEADQKRYPYLLSNGNCVKRGSLAGGRHFATWYDPFPKPCYLFAAVAGDFDVLEDSFTTASGRPVQLQLYVDKGKKNQCHHAMASLKKAMRWDEKRFGREYDLDVYMIVAVSDFNMGAMENKGLNIFNTKYVLASEKTATDDDFIGVESVIAHEYFHNWTGNRITCRDWFQLSLKEGLTVFRDQEFTADMHSPGVKRVQDVAVILGPQFAEDAGPMAHPIRPDAYIEMNNFYTVTVYNKGAEVIRMLQTLLGKDNFRAGMDLYFQRHDGQAVTCEDFVRCMEDASGFDLLQFRRWYSQAGTPEIHVQEAWEENDGTYELKVRQSNHPSPGQPEKKPFHIPLKVALLSEEGKHLPAQCSDATQRHGEWILELREEEQTFRFAGLSKRPLVSFLREFSAPVRVLRERSLRQIAATLAVDDDPYCRWEASQNLMSHLTWAHYDRQESGAAFETVANAFASFLTDNMSDPAFKALCLKWPSIDALEGQRSGIHPYTLTEARMAAQKALARRLMEQLLKAGAQALAKEHKSNPEEARGWRALKNRAFSLAGMVGSQQAREHFTQQFMSAQNMTDELAALRFLVHHGPDQEREAVLDRFLERWSDEDLVVDKWLAVQAERPDAGVLDAVSELWKHPMFILANPNKVRSLVGTFASNPWGMHQPDGKGYRWMQQAVLAVDKLNSQVAARLVVAFNKWKNYDETTGRKMREALEAISQSDGLSRDVAEIVDKALRADEV